MVCARGLPAHGGPFAVAGLATSSQRGPSSAPPAAALISRPVSGAPRGQPVGRSFRVKLRTGWNRSGGPGARVSGAN